MNLWLNLSMLVLVVGSTDDLGKLPVAATSVRLLVLPLGLRFWGLRVRSRLGFGCVQSESCAQRR